MPLMCKQLPQKLKDFEDMQKLFANNTNAVELKTKLLLTHAIELIEIMQSELVCEGILND